MKWFQHETDMYDDDGITDVMMKLNDDTKAWLSYAVYNRCLEIVGHELCTENISFVMPYSAEKFAYKFKFPDAELLKNIFNLLVDTGLAERNEEGLLRFPKMAYRLDRSTSQNPEFKKLLKKLKECQSNGSDCPDDVQEPDSGKPEEGQEVSGLDQSLAAEENRIEEKLENNKLPPEVGADQEKKNPTAKDFVIRTNEWIENNQDKYSFIDMGKMTSFEWGIVKYIKNKVKLDIWWDILNRLHHKNDLDKGFFTKHVLKEVDACLKEMRAEYAW